MTRSPRLALLAAALTVLGRVASSDVSTPEDRAALFEDIVAKTLRREAFSPVKNRILALDVEREMRRFKDEVLGARTDEELFFALLKVSNARKDRHLNVAPVPGGLKVDSIPADGEENYSGATATTPHAPLRFAVDYSDAKAPFIFVADLDKAMAQGPARPRIGDRVIAVNGRSFAEYQKEAEPYVRHSTRFGFWDKLASGLPQRSPFLPKSFYRERLTLGLEHRNGERYETTVAYLDPGSITWEGHWVRRYPGFRKVFDTPTFDFYLSETKRIVLLSWHGFGGTLVTDVDRLMKYAESNGLLAHDVIWDGTIARGGSKGAYAVQRLQPRPFRTTFGNLRLSDVTRPFIENVRQRFAERKVEDAGVAETLDGGRWLLDWLEDDVTKGLRDRQEYSNNVPFKLAHLPKHSDGIVRPAKVHFTGRLVCLFGPYGGSHLDQFAAIVADNGLGHSIGMPTGGYSNTWEWSETLVFPLSGKPVVRFMWNIGHTIRPNGQVLEGEAAPVSDYVPLTRDNAFDYYPQILARALRHLGH